MNLVEDIRPISYVKSHTAEILKQVGEKNNPMVITQNGEEKFRYILNDYYEAEQDSYQKGKITFKLSELAEGRYTLSFKVWDLLNNSTVKTLDFEVVKGLSPVIYSVINYPNPASEYVDIEVVHTRQTEKTTMNVDIFDLSGRKIYSFGENSESKIRWNLRGGNGEKVQPGMYIYRVSIKEY